ncbi:MAG: hypothetical protein V9G19_13890 [Tetrasphaera sp.]
MTTAVRRALHPEPAANRDAERGDVPGWVLITIMTAAIVAALWGFAVTNLPKMFEDAINSVKS